MLAVLLYALLAHALLAPLAADGIVPTEDFVPHVVTIVQARMALDEGQFPLRVAPWQHNGWQYPEYQFYSPLPYTFAAIVYRWLTPTNPYLALKLGLWLALVMAGFFTYRLTAWLSGSRPAALLAGAIYMAAPYFMNNIHARGAFPEVVAQGLMPAVVYSSARCYAKPGLGRLVPAAVAWFALATTHTITWVYGTLFVGLWLLLLGGRPRKTLARLMRSGAAYVFGCLLALYFLAPVVLTDNVQVRTGLNNPYTLNWYTPLPALLSPVSVAPEPQPGHAAAPHLHPAVGWPMLAGWAVVFYTLVTQPALLWRRAALRFARPLLALFVVALFMTWSPFDFWSVLPRFLRVTQYPYRILTQVMWPGALLSAYALVILFRAQLGALHVAAGLLLLGMAVSSYLPTVEASTVVIDRLVQRPDIGFGKNDYLVQRKSLDSAEIVAGVELPLVDVDGWLLLDDIVDIRGLARSSSSSLALEVKGEVPGGIFGGPIRLSALLEGERITSIQLPEGPFRWEVSLERAVSPRSAGRAGPVRLQVVSDKVFHMRDVDPTSVDRRALAVRAAVVTLRGAAPEQTALPVTQTQGRCVRQSLETTCTISVPPEVGLAQLPVLFYPSLLDVRVNGQAVAYVPLAHQTYALVGVRLPPGSHDISVRFRGLAWANWVSAAAWLVAAAAIALSFVRIPSLRGRNFEAARVRP